MNRRQSQKIDGYTFASKAEAKRYSELRLLAQAGAIEQLRVHPRFDLRVNGTKVCTFVADFDYVDRERGGRYVVEDCKPAGFRTRESKLKISLFNALHLDQGTQVTIVER